MSSFATAKDPPATSANIVVGLPDSSLGTMREIKKVSAFTACRIFRPLRDSQRSGKNALLNAKGSPMDCSLLFDTEDYTSPEQWGMDDIPMNLAKIMTEEGVTGSFLIIGSKARAIRDRRRKDVIAALRKHEIGLHTNFGSEHPTLVEALAPLSWHEAVRLGRQREEPGIRDLEDIFGTKVGSVSAHGATMLAPMFTVAGRDFRQPWCYSDVVGPEDDFCWYADCFHFSRFTVLCMNEGDYSDPDAITRVLAEWDRRIAEWVSHRRRYVQLFLAHPLMIRCKQFNDGLNFPDGRNRIPWKTPEMRSEAQMKVAMQQFRRVVRWIATHPDLNVRTLRQTFEKFGKVKQHITRDDLAAFARDAGRGQKIPTRHTISAAEALLAMAEGVSRKAVAARGKILPVLGPLDESIRFPDNERAWMDARSLVSLAKNLLEDVQSTGHLPTALRVPYGAGRMGLTTVFHVIRAAWQQLESGQKQMRVQVPHLCGNQPEDGHRVEAVFRRDWLAWPIHDIHLPMERISKDVRLQMWTHKLPEY